ncbi:MAG: hypothetical protein P1V51_17085 [Deltaproteobacteria bacterium]|nr:hypothetical protein [Deltaproteobacteria bacterium]
MPSSPPAARTLLRLGLLILLAGLALAPLRASAAGYFVPPGNEAYYLALSRRPAIAECGWEAAGITLGPQTVRYTFTDPGEGVEATVELAHPATCEAPAAGPETAFCVSLASLDRRPAGSCGAALLEAELREAIRVQAGTVRWIEPWDVAPAVLPVEPPPSATVPGDDPEERFSLYLLVLAAFAAWRLRRWRETWEGWLWLPPRERLALGGLLLGAAALGLGLYGLDGERVWWVGETALGAGRLLTPVSDPATEVGLARALLFHDLDPGLRLALAQLAGALALLYGFALAWRLGGSSRLALAVVALLGLSPLHGRLATAEPGLMLSLALALATLHAAAAWLASPSGERLWTLGTAYLAAAWLALGPMSLLGLPLLLVLAPLGARPAAGERRRGALALLLLGSLLLAAWIARGSPLTSQVAAPEHLTIPGILLHYHLVHPVHALLVILGLAEVRRLRGQRLVLALLAVLGGGVFWFGAAAGTGWSSLPTLVVLGLPLLLLGGAGAFRAARWLPSPGPTRPLVLGATLLLLLHHALLYHGVFGRLLFSPAT